MIKIFANFWIFILLTPGFHFFFAMMVVQHKQSLAGTIGEIQKETLDLRVAKREKNFEEVKNSLDSIIIVQNKRIEDLQKIIADLNKAASM